MKQLTIIEGEAIWEAADGSVYFCAGARIDADGSGGNIYNDPDFQDQTSLRKPDGSSLNADRESYIVVPPQIIQLTAKVVLGCHACVVYEGNMVHAVVADIGPRMKLGEISVQCARALGIPWHPRTGGISEHVVHYLLFPGLAAFANDFQYKLQPSH